MKYFALVLPEACKPEDIIIEELPTRTISYEKWRKLPRFADPDTIIGIVSFGPQMRYMALLDDNGLVNDTNPKPTINITGHIVCGPVAMCSTGPGGESIGFTEREVEKLLPVVKKHLIGHLNLPAPEPLMRVTPIDSVEEFDQQFYVRSELKRLRNNNDWVGLE